MYANLTIKNYRRYGDSHPLRFALEDGITSFVGLNNSGKSSVLRFFYELRSLWGTFSSLNSDFLYGLQGQSRGISFLGVQDPLEVFTNLNERNLIINFEFPATARTGPLEVIRFEIIITRPSPNFTLSLWTPQGKIENVSTYRGDNILLDASGRELANLTILFDFFRSLAGALYIGPFRNALNVGGTKYFDIDVGTAFIETWHTWQTGATKKHNEAIQSVVKNIRHIFGYRDLEIIAAREFNTLQVYADGRPYKLAELGGGITQFIVVLGNAAIKEPSIILIDEPELNLHPSLQSDFLMTLASYSQGRLLFATHSLGLSRAGADRIYAVRVLNGTSGITPYEETPRLAEFLGELSFAGFKELGFDKVLLVEGPTDIKTMQQFLRMVRKDHQIVTLSLGGAGMISTGRETEIAEVLRITDHVSVIIDSERDQRDAPLSLERQSFVDMCKRMKVNVLVLEKRAIENYLTDEAVKSVLGPKYEALDAYEKLANAKLGWGKHENWRVARQMRLDDIGNTDLAAFLRGL